MESFGPEVDRWVAPFEAAAILGAIGLTFPWHQSLAFAAGLVGLLILISAAVVVSRLRHWPRSVRVALACAGLALVLWPWGGSAPAIRVVLAIGVVLLIVLLHYGPWRRLPAWMPLLIPAGGAVLGGLLTVVNGSPPWLVFPLLLILVLWTALVHGRRQLTAILVLCILAQLAASVQRHDWAIQTVLYAALLVLVGASVHALVHRWRQEASNSAAVADVLRSLVDGGESGSIRQSLCTTLTELLGAPSVCIFELDAEARTLVPTAAEPRIPAIKVALTGEVFGPDGVSYGTPEPPVAILEAFTSGRPVFRPSLQALDRTGGLRAQEDQAGLRSTYCQPVLRDGRAVAVLSVAWSRGLSEVRPEQARLVAELADEVGLLLAQADLQGRVEALARSDSLTGVANRRHWEGELGIAVARAERAPAPLCVAVLDLDQFKAVNDDLGHQAGDRLLHEVAARWTLGLRHADLLGRYGGDEFAIILPNCEVEEALEVVERLRRLTTESGPFSAGLALWNGGESPSDLLMRADGALYEAKRAGGGVSRVARDRSAASEAWVKTLYAALAGEPLMIALQPIKDLNDGVAVGWEALARFQGIGPDVEPLFQAARRMGVSRDLDWLCRQAAIAHAGGLTEPIFVNTSVWSLLDARHPAGELAERVEAAGLEPANVVLELSERDRLSDARVTAAVDTYRSHGFRFALDDLGAGHSTLEALVRIDASYFKIAAGLLQDSDRRSRAAISALVHFAEQTGGRVIAEGVQNRRQLQRALSLGIELGQGYLLGRPEIATGLRAPAASER